MVVTGRGLPQNFWRIPSTVKRVAIQNIRIPLNSIGCDPARIDFESGSRATSPAIMNEYRRAACLNVVRVQVADGQVVRHRVLVVEAKAGDLGGAPRF